MRSTSIENSEASFSPVVASESSGKAAVKIKIWLSIRIFALGRYMFWETGVSGCFNRVVSSPLPHFLNFPLKRHFKQDTGMLVAFGIAL